MVLATLFFTNSCKKIDTLPTTASSVVGHVIEGSTSKPIANTEVVLIVQGRGGIGIGNTGSQANAYTHTDAKGYYSINFTSDDNYTYSIQASANGYYDMATPKLVNAGVLNTVNMALSPHAWLKTIITNKYMHTIWLSYSSVVNLKDSTAIIYDQVIGNKYVSVTYWIDKLDDNHRVLDSIYCNGFDTANYTISVLK